MTLKFSSNEIFLDIASFNLKSIICLLLICITGFSFSQESKTKAFPTAEGFGKYATGGRGGAVIKVINLNDSGPGSLRQALEFTSGPRTVIFEVGGTITLKSVLRVKGGNVTIAGQTAPGGGILIKDGQFLVESSNVIIRHLRFRYGTKPSSYDDSFSITAWGNDTLENIIIDHCSMSWGKDENFNIRVVKNGSCRNITLQNSIVSEGGKSLLLYGPRVYNISLFENLLANNRERNIRSNYPSDGKFDFEMVNNIIHGFSWGTVASTGSKFAVINNIYKKSSNVTIRGAAVEVVSEGGIKESYTDAYVSGNDVASGIKLYKSNMTPYLKTVPFSSSGIVARPADQIEDIILNVGASLPKRDAVDERIIQQYKNGNGSLKYIGKYPTIQGGKALVDIDNDGMPDSWEIANGLNPNDAKDRNFVQPDGYTNLEYYLNGMSLKTTTVTANAGEDQSICKGGSVVLTATGGKSYKWSTGAKTASITVSPNQTTTYTVTAFDSSGRNSDTDDIKVTVNPLPQVNAGPDKTITVGETVTLTAYGANSYKWSTGETTASISVRPTTSQNYSVTGSKNNCQAVASVKVNVKDPSIVSVNAGKDITIKSGKSTTLKATGAKYYMWNTGEKKANITVSPKVTTTYTVKGKNDETFEDTASVKVIVVNTSESTLVANAGHDQTICQGSNVTLNAKGGVRYLWSTGAKTSSIQVSPEHTTKYTVTVYDDSGKNSSSDDVTVTVTPLPPVSAGRNVSIISGQRIKLKATGAKHFMWSTGEKNVDHIFVSPKVTTTYTVQGKNDNSCEAFNTVTVFVNKSNGTILANAGKDRSICEGSSTTLSATGGASYLWSTGAKTSSIQVSPKTTTKYTVTVYDDSGKNSSKDDVTVTVNPLPPVSAGGNVSINSGDRIKLQATGAKHFMWSTGEKNVDHIFVSPKVTTTYTVQGKNDNPCETFSSVTVFVRPISKVAARGEIGDYPESQLKKSQSDDEVENSNLEHSILESADPLTDFKFTMHPNPTQGIINIKISGLKNIVTISIYDLSGKSLYTESIKGQNNVDYSKKIDLSNYESGIYLFKLVNNQKTISKKIVLK